MQSGQKLSNSPAALVASVWRERHLIAQFVRRDVISRYQGSLLGVAWSLFQPIAMLIVYTFVFSVIFKAKWNLAGEQGRGEFAIILFAGLIVHAVIAETITRAPGLIPANANLVKKVVFPLEILVIVTFLTATFHALVSFVVLVLALVVTGMGVSWTIIFAPLVYLPFSLVALGFGWFLASIGAYVRDIGQVVGILSSILLFLAPVFYPITFIPERYRDWFLLNPITFVVEQMRDIAIFGRLPDFAGLAAYGGVALAICWLGFAWFQKTRRGFADVL